ncbi:MAG TPA: flagellar basal-body MS-ring/collar protein FliF [Acidobacteriaceae bacterium]|jgi:flagellar M-ring protein FliF|nr:flagellar basal-body MS-ring/collar protein FliF [Acidobacteriaceae bacterium]
MAGFNDIASQAKQFWATRSSKQRIYLLSGMGATVILLALFVRMIGTPDYKPLFTGLEAADAQTLTAQLDAEGIPHQTSSDGKTISVPADKLDAARLKTASQGAPHSGRMGFELFDKMSWGQTEFDQKVTYQRALEGELERTIETLGDVESARVHLVMPADSVFIDRQQAAKASVILKLRGKGLPKSAVVAISHLVSGAVNELKPEDVSIIDADSARSLGLHQDGQDDGEGLDASLMQRLITTLEPVVGPGKIRASVNVDHSRESSEERTEKYDPTVSALLSDQKSEDTAGGGAVSSGVPGTTSNVPKADKTNPNPVQAATQSSKSETAQYGVNKVIVHTVRPSGGIERVSAAILVDDAIAKTVQGGKTSFTHRKRTADELKKIREIAQAVIGFDANRGDTISVENMAFDGDASEAELPAVNWSDKVHKTVSDYSSLLRPVSLLVLFVLVYMFALRPIQKHALSPGKLPGGLQPALADGSAAPVELGAELSHRLPGAVAELGDGSRRAVQLKEQTVELVKLKPANTARALQAWLREEQS